MLGCDDKSGSQQTESLRLSSPKKPSSNDLFVERIEGIFGSSGTFETDFKTAISFADEHSKEMHKSISSHSLRQLRELMYNSLRSTKAKLDETMMENIYKLLLVFRLVNLAGDMVQTVEKYHQGVRFVASKNFSVGTQQYLTFAKRIKREIENNIRNPSSNSDIFLHLNNFKQFVNFCKQQHISENCSAITLQTIVAIFFAAEAIPGKLQSFNLRIDISWEPVEVSVEFFKNFLSCENNENRVLFRDKFRQYFEVLPTALETPDFISSNSPLGSYIHLKKMTDKLQTINKIPIPTC